MKLWREKHKLGWQHSSLESSINLNFHFGVYRKCHKIELTMDLEKWQIDKNFLKWLKYTPPFQFRHEYLRSRASRCLSLSSSSSCHSYSTLTIIEILVLISWILHPWILKHPSGCTNLPKNIKFGKNSPFAVINQRNSHFSLNSLIKR